MVGRLRLWSGYVLFFYVVTHLLNHTLGLISLRVLEAGRHWFVLIWHNPIGQTVLYGALFGHFFLALWSLYRRRALKLSSWEWTQWILGALDHSAGRHARRRHAAGARALRRRDRLSLGAGLAGGRRLDRHRAAIRVAPRRLAACLHRPALRLAPAALVSHLAAAALRHRPAGAGRRHRRRRHRLARRRRPRPAAGLPRRPVRARARADAGRHRQPLRHLAQPADRRAGAAARRAERAARCATCGSAAPASSGSTTTNAAASPSRPASPSSR